MTDEPRPKKIKEQRWREWRLKNIERHRAYQREWARLHPLTPSQRERKREYLKRYMREYNQRSEVKKREKNRGEYKRKWNKLHPEKCVAYSRKWRRANPDKNAEYCYKRNGKGFVPIAPNLFETQVSVNWHHIHPNYPYVVALPKNVHKAVLGDYHYIYNAAMTCQIYGLNLSD